MCRWHHHWGRLPSDNQMRYTSIDTCDIDDAALEYDDEYSDET